MPRLSLRFIIVAIVALVSAVAIGLAASQLFRSKTRSDLANQVAAYMAIDRNLFTSLTQLRIERGWNMTALLEEPQDNRVHRQTARDGRQAFDAAIDGALTDLKWIPDAALRARGVELQSFLDTWRRLRPAVDPALDQPLAARDPALRKQLDEFGNRFLIALEAASDAVEKQIQALDSAFGSFLDARAAIWLTRTSSGRSAAIVSALLASGRAATPAEASQLNAADTQAHHGAMRHVAAVRSELPVRTIFNLLGPLCNPAGVAYQLFGVAQEALAEPLTRVLAELGSRRVWTVHGADGRAEVTVTGPTRVVALEDGRLTRFTIDPRELGLTLRAPEELRGGDPADNARALEAVLAGARNAYRDIAVLNAGAALVVAGAASTLADGLARAQDAVDSGAARDTLARLVRASNDRSNGQECR